MFACPTEALVMFPEGAVPPPLKVPEIDENFQTAVPGQYLIGEVAGKPLVKNAANLGRAVVEHMLHDRAARRRARRRPNRGRRRDRRLGPGRPVGGADVHPEGPVVRRAREGADDRVDDRALPEGQARDGRAVRHDEPVAAAGVRLVEGAADPDLEGAARARAAARSTRASRSRPSRSGGDGAFEVRIDRRAYRAQRVVLSIGTRGKPRTLQVPGENLPKIFSLLEDPDDVARHAACSSSAVVTPPCEAALALADCRREGDDLVPRQGLQSRRAEEQAGDRALRRRGPHQGQARLAGARSSTPSRSRSRSPTATQKRYPNDAAFVLIGADPPVAVAREDGRPVRRAPAPVPDRQDRRHRAPLRRRARSSVPRTRRAPPRRSSAARPASSRRVAAAVSLPMPMGGRPGPRPAEVAALGDEHLLDDARNSQMTPLPRRAAGAAAERRRRAARSSTRPMPLSEFAQAVAASTTHTRTPATAAAIS